MLTIDQILTQCAKHPRHAQGTTHSTFKNVWHALCTFISKTMLEGKGVAIPGFGTFTYKVEKLDAGTKGVKTTRTPVFVVSENFSRLYGVRAPRMAVRGATAIVTANFISVAQSANASKDTVTTAIKDIIAYVGDSVSKSFGLSLNFAEIGNVQLRYDKAKCYFIEGFLGKIRNLDRNSNDTAFATVSPSRFAEATRAKHLYRSYGPNTAQSVEESIPEARTPSRSSVKSEGSRTESRASVRSSGSRQDRVSTPTESSLTKSVHVEGSKIRKVPPTPDEKVLKEIEAKADTLDLSTHSSPEKLVKQEMQRVFRAAWDQQVDDKASAKYTEKEEGLRIRTENDASVSNLEKQELEKRIAAREKQRKLMDFNAEEAKKFRSRLNDEARPVSVGYWLDQQSPVSARGPAQLSGKQLNAALEDQVQEKQVREAAVKEQADRYMRESIKKVDDELTKEREVYYREKLKKQLDQSRMYDEQVKEKKVLESESRGVVENTGFMSHRSGEEQELKKKKRQEAKVVEKDLLAQIEERRLRIKEEKSRTVGGEREDNAAMDRDYEEKEKKRRMKKVEKQQFWREEWDKQKQDVETRKEFSDLDSSITSLNVGGNEHQKLVLSIARGESPGKRMKDPKLKTIYGW